MKNLTKIFVLITLIVSTRTFSDDSHFKNSLIGGRAGTMGGAYTAIADDASGAWYNPAGLAYASGDSISGSANLYSMKKSEYSDAISTNSWNRESEDILANFFGLVKRLKKYSFAFSYVVPDNYVEHQNDIFSNLSGLSDPINKFNLTLHTEDRTFLVGPSLSKDLGNKFSMGVSLFYVQRVHRQYSTQHIEYTDGNDSTDTSNVYIKEQGIKPILGFLWSPLKKWSFGLKLAQTMLIKAQTDITTTSRGKGSNDATFFENHYDWRRELPYEISLGVTYFASPYWLVSMDLDYYIANDSDSGKQDIWNLSIGSEIFFNQTSSLRVGLFTDQTDAMEVGASTVGPREYINLYGGTLGWGIHTKSTTVNLGAIYSMGMGDAQIYTGSSATREIKRSSLSFLISSSYNF